MAAWAAALTASGTSKSGCPMLRFTGSGIVRASSNTLRMPEASIVRMRSAIQPSAGEKSGMGRDSVGPRSILSCRPPQATPAQRLQRLAQHVVGGLVRVQFDGRGPRLRPRFLPARGQLLVDVPVGVG